MSIVKEGYIEKCGPKWSPFWNKRWCVLYDSRVIEYFVEEDKKTLKGIIELEGAESVDINDSDPGKIYTFGFSLNTRNRLYRFAAESRDERAEWCNLIKQVIAGHVRPTRTSRAKSKKRENMKRYKSEIPGNVTSAIASGELFKPMSGELGHKKAQSMNLSGHGLNIDLDDMKALSDIDLKGNRTSAISATSASSEGDMEEPIPGEVQKEKINYFEKIDANLLQRIRSFMRHRDIKIFFVLNKLIRDDFVQGLNLQEFYSYYQYRLFPIKALQRYSRRRQQLYPWILAHDYKQIWLFGFVPTLKYEDGAFNFTNIPVSNIHRLFLDDISLWKTRDNDIQASMACVKNWADDIRDLTVRSYDINSQHLLQLPKFENCLSLTLKISFNHSLFRNKVIPERLSHFSLLRVDLIQNEQIDGPYLERLFAKMTSLVTLHLEESRWKHSIIIPPQVKFLRYVPSDFSVIDLSRLVDDDEATNHTLDYELNYACDIILNHRNWPSVLNSSILAGHDALQGRRLRVWVIKKKRKWDQKVMNVNYCMEPPPLKLYERNNCYNDCLQLDKLADMSAFWTTLSTAQFTEPV